MKSPYFYKIRALLKMAFKLFCTLLTVQKIFKSVEIFMYSSKTQNTHQNHTSQLKFSKKIIPADNPKIPLLSNMEICHPSEVEKRAKNLIISRYYLLSKVQSFLAKNDIIYKSITYCNCSPIPSAKNNPFSGNHEIHAYIKNKMAEEISHTDKGQYGYYGISQCANSLLCPVCSSKINSFRRDEIIKISTRMIQNNYQILLLTHTAPHNKDTDIEIFTDLFQKAMREMKKPKAYKKLISDIGLKFYIRAPEMTLDKDESKFKTGVHWHTHSILFFDKKNPFSERQAEKFRLDLAKMWAKALLKVGMINENEIKKTIIHGTNIQLPRTFLNGNITNQDDIIRLAEYITKGMAFELACGQTKKGRKNRITHWEYIKKVVENPSPTNEQISNVRAIFMAMKGRAALLFSSGLKKFCDMETVKDEDILRGKKSLLIYEFGKNNPDWKKITSKGKQKHYINSMNEFNTILEAELNASECLYCTANNIDIHSGEVLQDLYKPDG